MRLNHGQRYKKYFERYFCMQVAFIFVRPTLYI